MHIRWDTREHHREQEEQEESMLSGEPNAPHDDAYSAGDDVIDMHEIKVNIDTLPSNAGPALDSEAERPALEHTLDLELIAECEDQVNVDDPDASDVDSSLHPPPPQ